MSGDVGAEVAAVLDERLRALYGADFVFDSDAKYLLGALAPLIDERVEAAKAEALREAADVSLLDLAAHGCGWRTLDHDSTAVKGYCGSTTAEALNDWLRDRADALDPEATP